MPGIIIGAESTSAPNQRKETIVKQLLTIIRCWLKRSQYRTDLIDGFLAHTGLSLEPDSN